MTAAEPHTCHAGPLCPPWYEDANRGDYPDCGHGSCAEMMSEPPCVACFLDAVRIWQAAEVASGEPVWVRCCDDPGCVITASHKHGAA